MTTPAPNARVELSEPVTGFAPMAPIACGGVPPGPSTHGRWPAIPAGAVPAGPVIRAASRPIPSGGMPGRPGPYVAAAGTALARRAGVALRPRAGGP